jgi:propionyl-CoA synthetase
VTGRYRETYERSLRDRDAFWAELAKEIDWERRWDRVLDADRAPFHRWFAGGVLNTCHNAVDRHVERGRGEQPALIYDSPVTGTQRVLTYHELQAEVARFAGVLARQGVTRGDRVLIFMPMVPEAVVAMLACARIGAVHVVVFGGFAAPELASRIDDVSPRVVVAASCGIEGSRLVPYKPALDQALELASAAPERCIVLQRPQAPAELVPCRDVDWEEAMASAEPAGCVPVAATDPLYILHTSGTTGRSKGVVRDNGGHAVALAYSMRAVYGVEPGETFWAASDIGWVVGHSYSVYAPLLHGCASVIYEGKPVGTPDPGAFWRVIEEHGVHVMFVAPTALRAVKQADPTGALAKRTRRPAFRTLFVAGEHCDPDTLAWARDALGVPVIDHWWQTETGWAIGANPVGIETFPVKPGSITKPMPGYDLHVLDRDSSLPVATGQAGSVALRLPLPPGGLLTLWNNDDGFRSAYLETHPGYYATNDSGFVDEDGYLWIMGRVDDVMNVAGHRISAGAIEEALSSHPDVAESAVVSVPDDTKGEVPIGLVVLNAGVATPEPELEAALVALVRERIGPVASFKRAKVVERLPKTRSGKVLRGTLRDLAAGRAYAVPATIDDPDSLVEIAQALEELGYRPALRSGSTT